MEIVMGREKFYIPPMVLIHRVVMDEGVAQTTVTMSAKVAVEDWVDEGTVVGADPAIEGGDIFLY